MKTVNEKILEGRQYRDINLQNIECRADDQEKQRVTGYACTFNDEYLLYRSGDYSIYEKIDPDAFSECDMSDVIMQYNHEGRVFARTSNGTLNLEADDHGLKINADLSGTELGRQVYDEIRGGYTTKMSFGFVVKEDKREVTEDHENGTVTVLRTITKFEKLYDVSAVSQPANDGTSISARSFGEGVIAEIEQELQEREARNKKKQKLKILLEV